MIFERAKEAKEAEGRKRQNGRMVNNDNSKNHNKSPLGDLGAKVDLRINENRMKGIKGVLLVLIILPWISGCYSLKGYSIAPDVKSFYVGNFKLTALNAPATINQTFAEALKDKVARESRLQFTDLHPDLEFNGTVQSFIVSAVAPKPNEQTSFNRLSIHVAIEYTNHLDAKEDWKKTFTHFADFSTDQNLLQVQDELITIIFNQILEDVFNQAFNNW